MIFAFVILGYLLGSIPFGKLIGLTKGIDIQKQGSGNIGFANSVRVLGWRLGVVVLAGDVLKGYAAVLIASMYVDQSGLLLVGAAALLGHVYPVWLRFKGGKAIATGLGVLLLVSPVAAVGAAIVYSLVFAAWRISGVASLSGAFSLPLWGVLFAPGLTGYFALLALFAAYTHRTNIRQLVLETYGRR